MFNKLSQLPAPLQQSLIYASAIVISKGLALIMVPVATHYLTPADYGRLRCITDLSGLAQYRYRNGFGRNTVSFRRL